MPDPVIAVTALVARARLVTSPFPMNIGRPLCTAFLFLSLAGPGIAQAFVVDNGVIPAIPGNTENVDFGDVDLDGDWDAALAMGGIGSQNRLWINQGGLQAGPLGSFRDETVPRLPLITDVSHDVEFADIDDDGDLDLHVTNATEFQAKTSRWLVNVGGKQGGTLGYYVDETIERWVGIAEPGSSIPPELLTAEGEWRDNAHDGDFADLDNDGDLDLVHTSYGNPCDGGEVDVPTRIFLNDGDGFFEELNPSGFTPLCGVLLPGDPGLWCDGVYLPKTADVTGVFCDVTADCQDVDVGDIDGDFDLDLILSDSQFRPRAFANRLERSTLAPDLGGAPGFRDVTGVVLPLPEQYSIADNRSEHEFGDLDEDGDLDLLGVDWDVSVWYGDVVLENVGGGLFGNPETPPHSLQIADEGDFLDYDNDGDLDYYIASSAPEDELYRNDGGLDFTKVSLPFLGTSSRDADAADTDGDGDYDLVVVDWIDTEVFLKNVTQIPDTHAPYIPNVETIGDRTASVAAVPLRAHVYDNAPYYITWYNDTVLEVRVAGVGLPPIEAESSMGQVFRAEHPGNLVGAVDYRFVSSDEYGNTGASAVQSYTATTSLTYAIPYGQGTVGTLAGTEPTIAALSVPFGGSTLYLAGHSDAPPGTSGVFVLGLAKYDQPQLLPGIVLANVHPPYFVVELVTTDADGDAVIAVDVPSVGPGFSAFAQFGAFDPPATGEILSGSQGLQLVTQ